MFTKEEQKTSLLKAKPGKKALDEDKIELIKKLNIKFFSFFNLLKRWGTSLKYFSKINF